MSKTLNQLFTKIIQLNEIGEDSPYTFSDPDGVRSGKSGWSFGAVQFDTKNNDAAIKCLIECGFTKEEIEGVVNQTIDVKPLEKKLKAGASIIDSYCERQLQYCLDGAGNFVVKYCLSILDSGGLLAIADYWNQYGSMGYGAGAWLRSLNRPITAEDILTFKLEHTKYGREHPKDCKRRYNNLIKVTKENV